MTHKASRAAAREGAKTGPTRKMPAPGATPLRVVILDDRPDHAELMVHQLNAGGFAPEWVRVDTEESFRTALSSSPDVVLADYNLPQYGGMQALQTLASLGLDTPCILVSGTIGEELAVSSLRAGAADYLLKDRLARLSHAVVQALDRTRLLRERAQAETLRARLAAVVESSDDAMLAIARDGTILTWNQGATAMFGYASDTVIGQSVTRLVPSESAADLVSALARATRGEPDTRCDTMGVTRAGTTFNVSATLSPIRGAGDQVQEVSAVFRNVTAQKQAEEVLRLHALEQNIVAYLGRWALSGIPSLELLRDGAALIARTLGATQCLIFGRAGADPELVLLAGVSCANLVGSAKVLPRTSPNTSSVPSQIGDVTLADSQTAEWTAWKFPGVDTASKSAAVRIQRGASTLGLLIAFFPASRASADADVHFLQAVASVLAEFMDRRPAATESVTRPGGTRDAARGEVGHSPARRRRRQRSTQSLLRSLAGNDTEQFRQVRDGLLMLELYKAISTTSADKGTIHVLDPAARELRVAVQLGFEQPFLSFFDHVSAGTAPPGTAWATKQPVTVDNVEDSPIVRQGPTLDAMLTAGVRAVLSIPLIDSSGDVVGVLSTYHRRPTQAGRRLDEITAVVDRAAACIGAGLSPKRNAIEH